ncbi:MAG: hypothetical protein WCP29_13265 [Acidobacteriota bacterium]
MTAVRSPRRQVTGLTWAAGQVCIETPPEAASGSMSGPEECVVAKLKSEFEITCPCCSAVIVVDKNLDQVISHREPPRSDTPDLDFAAKLVADEKARREAAFEQSVQTQKTRGDALSKRFEEALRAAREEPISKPKRDFDLD